MIDIIIPVYKAKSTLLRTLMSIAIQKDVSLFDVYLVIDDDGEDYSYEIDFVSKFYPIKAFYLDKNGGPGVARQYGIEHTNNPYIMFIDADDYLYTPYSLSLLMKQIKESNFDLLLSNFRYERDNEVIIKREDFTWLHGKIYKRKFLVDNNIRFNDTRANEDNGFNRLLLFHKPNIYYLKCITYVYSENTDSITRRDNRDYKFTGLEYFTYNVNWAIKEALKDRDNVDINLIAKTCYDTILSMYYYYSELCDKYDGEKIISWTRDTYLLFKDLSKNITEEEMKELEERKEQDNIKIKLAITLEEFIQKVSDYND